MRPTRAAWNRGRAVGERLALTIHEAQALFAVLQAQSAHHDACLFAIGVDSMLRCSDLLKLRVRDVVDSTGRIRWKQLKTGRNVYPVLTTTSREALSNWITVSGKTSNHFLFTRDKPNGTPPIASAYYRTLIKKWVKLIGLKPDQYSTHSLRRTKPSYLYHYGFSDLEHIARLLGHATTDATSRYLGIQKQTAQAHALEGDLFTADQFAEPMGHPLLREFLKPSFLEQFVGALCARTDLKPAGFIDESQRRSTK